MYVHKVETKSTDSKRERIKKKKNCRDGKHTETLTLTDIKTIIFKYIITFIYIITLL